MHDCIEAFEIGRFDIAGYPSASPGPRYITAKCTACVEVAIQPHDLVPVGLQHGDKDRADVAIMTRYQYFHFLLQLSVFDSHNVALTRTIQDIFLHLFSSYNIIAILP